LDVGTDNRELLNDPLYLGWRHERMRGKEYDDFIELFVQAVIRKFPNVLLQWEDFSKNNAHRLLVKYQDRLCTFNDDIQGTGAVTMAGLLAACAVNGSKISQQRIVILGAGSAAMGISEQIVTGMMTEEIPREQAISSIWLVDSEGLVHTGRNNLTRSKQTYAQPLERLTHWKLNQQGGINLEDVVYNVHPTILIGAGAQPGAFHEKLVREMAKTVERPIIFPLSNPTSKSEAVPADLFAWTEGRALVATGSPFDNVIHGGKSYRIGQCNNALIFPGVGLGVIASGARRVTNEMFVAAARALTEFSPILKDASASLYPRLEEVRKVSRTVAFAVATEAQRAKLADQISQEELTRRVNALVWEPEYIPLKRSN
jgi:malate dehydrogenase (oxaloacetate-decarboxylating)